MKKLFGFLILSLVMINALIPHGAVHAKTKYSDYTDGRFIGSKMISQGSMTRDSVDVNVDGFLYEGEIFTLKDTAYVGLREFATMADNAVVSWDNGTQTARVTTDSLTLTVPSRQYYMDANGRVLWCAYGNFTLNSTLYVPLIQVAHAFGFDYEYSSADHTTYLTRVRAAIIPGEEFYDANDLYWLAKIIHAESRGEPFIGKIAVGNVILNRVDSDEFPDNIYDVIFDRKNGVQFSPTVDGAINLTAGEESVLAAKLCLEDTRLSDTILYFLNKKMATSFWIVDNCTFVVKIGSHDFYS
ncbi:MAG: cell wall hydrolase [Clostridia bacterium]|nr:cell wall hydrolase [Clostridia bacterium]